MAASTGPASLAPWALQPHWPASQSGYVKRPEQHGSVTKQIQVRRRDWSRGSVKAGPNAGAGRDWFSEARGAISGTEDEGNSAAILEMGTRGRAQRQGF